MHRHIFKMVDWQAEGYPVAATIAIAKCECGEQLGPTGIERRLNAVECLQKALADVLVWLHSPSTPWPTQSAAEEAWRIRQVVAKFLREGQLRG